MLHRVVCCYPDLDALLGAAAERASNGSCSRPPHNPLSRAVVWLLNFAQRLRRHEFRVFVWPRREVERVAESRGLLPGARGALLAAVALGRVRAVAARTMGAMAVHAGAKLDVEKIGADFAYLDELVNGKPWAFLDSAASSQKPRQMLDAMRDFYEHSYANVHRGVYTLAERATAAYEGARAQEFVNARSHREIVFTRQATEAINLVAYAWGLNNLGPGDLVVVRRRSSITPTTCRGEYVAKRTGATFRMLPLTDSGEAVRAARRDRARQAAEDRDHELRLELTRHDQRRRAARGLGARQRGRVRVRRSAGGAARVDRHAERSAATSSRSRRTRCSGVGARCCGAARSCSSRWSRSTSAAT